MRGTLQPGTLPQVLGDLFAESRSGVLRVTRDHHSLALWLREGRTARIEAPAAARRRESSGPLAGSLERRLGSVLRDLGIPQERRERAARPDFTPALSWQEGEYAFEDRPAGSVAADAEGNVTSTVQLVREAVRLIEDRSVVDDALGDPESRLAPGPVDREALETTPSERVVLSQVDGTRTIQEVMAAATLPAEEAQRSLLCLLCLGGVERVAPSRTPAAGGPEAEPAEAESSSPPAEPASVASAATSVEEEAVAAAEAAQAAEAEADRLEARPSASSSAATDAEVAPAEGLAPPREPESSTASDQPVSVAGAATSVEEEAVTAAEEPPGAVLEADRRQGQPGTTGSDDIEAEADSADTQALPAEPEASPVGAEPGTALGASVEETTESPEEPSLAAAGDAELTESEPEPEPAGDAAAFVDEGTAGVRRREIEDEVLSLLHGDHFEVLGIRWDATDRQVREAYVRQAKRFHPDRNADPALAGLREQLQALFIRIGEAYEVLRHPGRRARYRAELAAQASAASGQPSSAAASQGPMTAEGADAVENALIAEDAIRRADQYLHESRYWDVIQMMEAVIPWIQSKRLKHAAQIRLARAYAKNPYWVRKGEDLLQAVVREDPSRADAYFVLGTLYQDKGLRNRAITMFRKVLDLDPHHWLAAAQIRSLEQPTPANKRLLGRT